MKIKIESTDRLGISQEILATIAQQNWNVKAVEVGAGTTYIHIQNKQVNVDKIYPLLEKISGVQHCELIDLMPSEQKSQHLSALLANIPEAIIDVDINGMILALNEAASTLFNLADNDVSTISVSTLLNIPLNQLISKSRHSRTVSLVIHEQSYIADITPVIKESIVSGAILIIRSVNNIGRQISLIQAREEHQLDGIIGESKQIQGLKKTTLKYAALNLPVLITGETGTGKELFARALHEASDRAQAPFLAINCAALPENLLESELFGYAAGAFTGAQRGGKPGLFELAEGGTIFLDEIAEMSPYLQAKLLRFLQDFTFRRIGSSKELLANVRIISATHQNIMALIEQQKFREDLYYRINVLTLSIPPLRERVDDIENLSRFFIHHAAVQTNQQTPILTESAMTCLKSYHWPGNVRELQNSLFRLVALLDHQKISVMDIEQSIKNDKPILEHETSMSVSEFIQDESLTWTEAQQQFERRLLMELYPFFPSTRKLAHRLQVSHNKIAMKLRQYGIK